MTSIEKMTSSFFCQSNKKGSNAGCEFLWADCKNVINEDPRSGNHISRFLLNYKIFLWGFVFSSKRDFFSRS